MLSSIALGGPRIPMEVGEMTLIIRGVLVEAYPAVDVWRVL